MVSCMCLLGSILTPSKDIGYLSLLNFDSKSFPVRPCIHHTFVETCWRPEG